LFLAAVVMNLVRSLRSIVIHMLALSCPECMLRFVVEWVLLPPRNPGDPYLFPCSPISSTSG
jgi:hypothetical protein